MYFLVFRSLCLFNAKKHVTYKQILLLLSDQKFLFTLDSSEGLQTYKEINFLLRITFHTLGLASKSFESKVLF